MPSIRAKVIDRFLQAVDVKDSKVLKAAEKLRHIPLYIRFEFATRSIKIHGENVVIFQQKKVYQKLPMMHIVFLHGGAYVREATALHWRLLRTLITKLNCRISYVDYPLAPKHTYKDTKTMVLKTCEVLQSLYPKDSFVFMGDSAGGGLALALLQTLKKENKNMPQSTVLFSPWLDISMQNPEIEKFKELDLMLSVDELIDDAKSYAGNDDPHTPFVSPIYGEFDGLGDVAVFYGTHEVLMPDCLLLQEKVKDSTSRFVFYEFENMQHDFILLPIPEAKDAIDKACEFIVKNK